MCVMKLKTKTMTREDLEKEKEQLEKQREQIISQANQIVGAIALCDKFIKDIDESYV